MFTTPGGLDEWWTQRSSGEPKEGAEYELWFGPEYDWRARVTRCVPDVEFELQMTRADADWTGTRVGAGHLQLELDIGHAAGHAGAPVVLRSEP